MKFFTKKSFLFKVTSCLCVTLIIFMFLININVYAALFDDVTLEGPTIQDRDEIESDPQYQQTQSRHNPSNHIEDHTDATDGGEEITYYKDGCWSFVRSGTKYVFDADDIFVPHDENDNTTSTLTDNNLSTYPTPSTAHISSTTSTVDTEESPTNLLLGIGGKLLQPIIDLCMGMGDGIINLLQKAIMGTESELAVDTSRGWIAIAIGTAVAILIVVAIVATGGLAGLSGIGAVAAGVWGVVKTASKGALIAGAIAYIGLNGTKLPEVVLLPLYEIGPEEIFKGELAMFDVNIFNPKEVWVKYGNIGEEFDGTLNNNSSVMKLGEWNETNNDGTYKYNREQYEAKAYFFVRDGSKPWEVSNDEADSKIVLTSSSSTAFELKTTISRWYYTLRNLAIVIMMVVLVYVGIRMIISATAQDKAKYKQMLMDWLVGMCLLFVMHYIMVFAIEVTEAITNLFASVAGDVDQVVVINDAPDKLIEKVEEEVSSEVISGNTIKWPTNFMGRVRILAQEQTGTFAYIGCGLAFLVLVIYTFVFAITYLKRVLYIMFLTLIAPLVAVTYPIDKINDGKAQGFDMWLKEYIFNLLIQPMHLILYIVLMGTAVELSANNILYTIVAIGFMIPAEKLLRKMFNFEKAHTPGFLGGATGAAMVMSGLGALSRLGSSKNKGSGNNKNAQTKNNSKINMAEELGVQSGHGDESLLNAVAYKDANNPALNPNNYLVLNPNNNNEDTVIPPPSNENIETDYAEPYIDSGESTFISPVSMEDLKDPVSGEAPLPYIEPETIQIDDDNTTGGEIDQAKYKDDGEVPDTSEEIEMQSSPVSAGLKVAGGMVNKAMDKVLGTGVRFAGAATGATIGLAAGIASDNLGNVVKYTGAGAMAGRAVGNTAVNTTTRIASVPENVIAGAQNVSEQYKQELYGTNYSKVKRQEAYKQMERDSGARKKYAQDLGVTAKYKARLEKAKNMEERSKIRQAQKEELDTIMKQRTEYFRNGITDDSIIIKGMNLNPNNRVDQDSMLVARMATTINNTKQMDQFKKRMQQKGISDSKIAELEKKTYKIKPSISV